MLISESNLKQQILNTLACSKEEIPNLSEYSVSDWDAWLHICRMHRVLPLLHWKYVQTYHTPHWPETVLVELSSARQHHALRALQMQRELVYILRLLKDAQIRSMALKGAYLAWHAYPSPELRPIRDIDILVPAEQALQAYDILLKGGFRVVQGCQGDANIIVECDKHLPGLKRDTSTIKIELHARLAHLKPDGNLQHELSMQPGFWQRAVACTVAGESILYPSPTDQLLHLLTHAIFDHQLNNGPLIFTDVQYLIANHYIDWPLFWQQADAMDCRPAVTLGLQLVRYHIGSLAVDWLGCEPRCPPDELLDTLRCFSLRDLYTRGEIAFAHQLNVNWFKRLIVLRQKLLPSSRALAKRYPVKGRVWTLPYWYLRTWADGLKRLIEIKRNKRSIEAKQAEISALRQLNEWLESSTAAGKL